MFNLLQLWGVGPSTRPRNRNLRLLGVMAVSACPDDDEQKSEETCAC